MSVIALTGATGFVGSHVLDRACATASLLEGKPGAVKVRALTRRDQPGVEGVTWVRGDLNDAAALGELVAGADAVIHVAGLTNTPDPAQFHAANVTGTANVIAAMKGANIKRLVFVSSLAARMPDLSAYGASKAEAEALVEASGLDWTTVRPPGVYGPRDVDYLEMFRTAKAGFVPLPPGGASSIIHVRDLADLLVVLAVNVSPISKQTYEPDDGREGGWSHKELAQAIGRAVGKRRVFAPHLPQAILQLAARIDGALRGEKAKLTADRVGYMCHPNWVSRFDRKPPAALWQPKIAGEEGLKATAEWYRQAGWL